jgi:NADPH-dependent curcumin reductase CurA
LANVAREIHLKSRPAGEPKPENFELVERPLPELGDGEVLVRNVYMSVDPYMRGRMRDVKSYVPPFAIGEALQGGAIGKVEASHHPGFVAGDYVNNGLGWRDYLIAPGETLQKVDGDATSLTRYLGALGGTGFTAYIGLLDLMDPQEGETVFVSGAAGAVGLIVGQLAKIRGCYVVGSAGSDEKVGLLTSEFGYDAAFNYKTADVTDAVGAQFPDGIDVYFDNVGGDHLQAALEHMKDFGRISACGAISLYNLEDPAPGPNNMSMVVRKRLTIKGFIVSDHGDRREAFQRDMLRWLGEGDVVDHETVIEGLENAPEAFMGLFSGQNVGKMLVKIGEE